MLYSSSRLKTSRFLPTFKLHIFNRSKVKLYIIKLYTLSFRIFKILYNLMLLQYKQNTLNVL